MFNVFGRHAASSAVLMFNSGPDHGEAIGEYRGDDPLYHVSLSPYEYTELLGNIGFEVIAHVVGDWKTGGGRTVCGSRKLVWIVWGQISDFCAPPVICDGCFARPHLMLHYVSQEVARSGRTRLGRASPLCPGSSDVNLFRYYQGVVHLDIQISHRVLLA
jgi:hypothetical protein